MLHEEIELVVMHPVARFLYANGAVVVEGAEIEAIGKTPSPAFFAPDDKEWAADLVPEVAGVLHIELVG